MFQSNVRTFRNYGKLWRWNMPKSVSVYIGIKILKCLTLNPPLTAETFVQSQAGPCGFCGGSNGTGTGFSLSTLAVPVSIIPSVLHAICSSIIKINLSIWQHHNVTHFKKRYCHYNEYSRLVTNFCSLFIHILRICNKQQPSYGGLEYILQLYFFFTGHSRPIIELV
jgi:hypothetical protein